MAHGRRAYLGEVAGDWSGRLDAAQRLADRLALHVTGAMAARG